ncbi:unnamed protein product [Polarella glacialis]|uniref:Uncharacterized protein n=1 Tax=Polarella glacialis TaxID=89957 RepID=A0A813FEX5_POLGL|nr:unnamed protein product [Polarella glacialis]
MSISGPIVIGSSGRLHSAVVLALAAYVSWVLLGTVAWVSHLGSQCPTLAPWLPGRGRPGASNPGTDGLLSFLTLNLPSALTFVLPHSLCKQRRLHSVLQNFSYETHDRLAYNVIAAVTLHYLLATMVPLQTPVVFEMPIPASIHLFLSGGFLFLAAFCFATDGQTAALLGVSKALCWRQKDTGDMDAITWLSKCVQKRGGDVALVLFTGVSIVPPQLTLGDALTRCVAALYLRWRSGSFRRFLHKVEESHLLGWAIRGLLLWASTSKISSAAGGTESTLRLLCDWRIFGALAIAMALRGGEKLFTS